MPESFRFGEDERGVLAICIDCDFRSIFPHVEKALVEPAQKRARDWAKKHEVVCKIYLAPLAAEKKTVPLAAEKKTALPPDSYIHCEQCNALARLEDGQCLNCGKKFDYAK